MAAGRATQAGRHHHWNGRHQVGSEWALEDGRLGHKDWCGAAPQQRCRGGMGGVRWSDRTPEAGALAGCCLRCWLMVVVLGWWLVGAAGLASGGGRETLN